MQTLVRFALALSGVFSLTLGAAHFFFPLLLDFEHAIPKVGGPLKPFRLWFIRHATTRADVHGIAWVMNHAASYVLVSLGLLNLYWAFTNILNPTLALWVAGWWALRAGSQLYLGQRRGDWLVLSGFASLSVLHFVVALLA